MNRVRFSRDDAERASVSWNFNCGPAALCAVLDMTPGEIRPHLLDFEAKGYTNPTLMTDILRGLGVRYRQVYRSDEAPSVSQALALCAVFSETVTAPFLLIRVQWGGPWARPGVPMRVRYRQTHWIAQTGDHAFDVNAMCVGGWIPIPEWSRELAPWLIRECCPNGDGTWWPTHALEVWPAPQPTPALHGAVKPAED